MRERYTATMNGLKMGSCLSVCFPEGMSPIVKIGGDEVIFKIHSENKSYWEIDDLKVISPKSEGKGNMKVVFVDEIVGVAGNCSPPQMMERFQSMRKRGYVFKNPMFMEWEYGKSEEDQGMGYWTSQNMKKLVTEYIELFNFLHPDHTMLLNIDWSANHIMLCLVAKMTSPINSASEKGFF